MPLEGVNSVIGRSIVIHNANSSRWACTNIVYDQEAMGGAVLSAVATFDGDIQGTIKLVSGTYNCL